MHNQKSIIDWGSDYFTSIGCELIQSPVILVQTPWSIVVRFITTNGIFYLKQTPPDLFIETNVIKTIQKIMPQSLTPHILSENKELKCFLMESCGDNSLRTKFNGTIDDKSLTQGLTSYLQILRSFEDNIVVLKDIRIPDWRLHRIPDLYVELLAQHEILLEEGLTHDEMDELLRLVPKIRSLSDTLSEQKVKETLVNGDFNENNLIINIKTQQISIIDWGESVIAHPFFSIASHLQSCARRYQLKLNKGVLEKIKQHCLSHWLDVASIEQLNSTYQQLSKLHPIFCALALYRLQVATNNKSKTMQNWFIADFLKKLLKNESDEMN